MLPGTLSASRRRAQSLKARHPTAGLPARIHARNLVHLGVKGDCLPSQAQSLKAREREEERERERERAEKRRAGKTREAEVQRKAEQSRAEKGRTKQWSSLLRIPCSWLDKARICSGAHRNSLVRWLIHTTLCPSIIRTLAGPCHLPFLPLYLLSST